MNPVQSALTAWISAIFLLGTVSVAGAASSERDLRQLTEWLVGVWDNDNQVRFEGLGYLEGLEAVPEADRHTRMRVFIQRVDLPWLGEHVLYLEHYAGLLDRPYRQQILHFWIEDRTIYQESFRIARAERLAGAWDDPAKLKQISRADLTPALTGESGCRFVWSRSAGQFYGEITKGRCVIESRRHPGEKRIIVSSRALSQNALHMDEGGFREDGTPAFGRKDGIPHQLARARAFSCWFAVHPEAGTAPATELANRSNEEEQEADWTMARFAPVYDRGGSVDLPKPSDAVPRYSVILRQTEFPVGRFNDVLELFVHQEGVERAVAYAWTEPDAERIGIQLRYLQGSCSLLK